MSVGTRFNAIKNVDTILQFQFLKNTIPFSASSISKVEIYDNLTDAQSQTNPIQIINALQVVESTTGLYTYTASAVATEGVYYDRIFLIPEIGIAETSFLNQFNVQAYSSGTPIIIADKTLIVGNLVHPTGDPDTQARIIIQPESISEIGSDNVLVTTKQIKVKPNALGQWFVNLYPSSVLGGTKYKFRIVGRHIDVTRTISVPALAEGQTQINFEELFTV